MVDGVTAPGVKGLTNYTELQFTCTQVFGNGELVLHFSFVPYLIHTDRRVYNTGGVVSVKRERCPLPKYWNLYLNFTYPRDFGVSVGLY